MRILHSLSLYQLLFKLSFILPLTLFLILYLIKRIHLIFISLQMFYIAALFACIVFLLVAIAGVIVAKISPSGDTAPTTADAETTTTTTTELPCIPDGPDAVC
jgi:hypothetical protein